MNIFNKDFQDFIKALNKHDVSYMLVGGFAVILHGYLRSTGDLDIWVNRTEINYYKLKTAMHDFGLMTESFTFDRFLFNKNEDVHTFGRRPISIDIMLELKGLDFDEAYKLSNFVEVENLKVRLIHLSSLKIAKRAAGRLKDLLDLEKLEEE